MMDVGLDNAKLVYTVLVLYAAKDLVISNSFIPLDIHFGGNVKI